MTIERMTTPQHLRGMRAIGFHARTKSLDDDCTVDVLHQASAWITAHRAEACPLSIELDQWSDNSALRNMARPEERLLAEIFPKAEGPWVWHHASAVVYYEAMAELGPIPDPPQWAAPETAS